MATPTGDEYLVADEPLDEPLVLVDVEADGTQRACEFETTASLDEYLREERSHVFRLISICQRNSWQPLQLTGAMADAVTAHHGLSPAFRTLLSCFYGRSSDREASFIVPFGVTEDEGEREDDVGDGDDASRVSTEVSYSIRYPEQRKATGGGETVWVMRQSAVLVQETCVDGQPQTLAVLVNPMPGSACLSAFRSHLEGRGARSAAGTDWLHPLLFKTYMPAWRWYLASVEEKLSRLANDVIATYIDEPLERGHDALNSLAALEAKCLHAQTTLETTTRQLEDIVTHLQDQCSSSSSSSSRSRSGGPRGHIQHLRFQGRQVAGHAGTAALLRQRAQMTNQFLAGSLSFRDQAMTKEQSRTMLRLNKSAVFITSLTLVYVPASYMATFFGMNFFFRDEGSGTIAIDPMVWIYVLSTVLLSGLTYLLYYLVLHIDSIGLQHVRAKLTLDRTQLRAKLWRVTSMQVEKGGSIA